jgi:hypothetical protein
MALSAYGDQNDPYGQRSVRTYLTVEAARDLASEGTPAPEPVDASGRSDQTFVVDVVVRAGSVKATCHGPWPGHLRGHRTTGGGGRPANPGRADADSGRNLGQRHVRAVDFLPALTPHLSVELPRLTSEVAKLRPMCGPFFERTTSRFDLDR